MHTSDPEAMTLNVTKSSKSPVAQSSPVAGKVGKVLKKRGDKSKRTNEDEFFESGCAKGNADTKTTKNADTTEVKSDDAKPGFYKSEEKQIVKPEDSTVETLPVWDQHGHKLHNIIPLGARKTRDGKRTVAIYTVEQQREHGVDENGDDAVSGDDGSIDGCGSSSGPSNSFDENIKDIGTGTVGEKDLTQAGKPTVRLTKCFYDRA